MTFSTWPALFKREWIQHRFAWGLMALVPLALGLLLVGFGQISIGDKGEPQNLPLALTMGSFAGTTAVYGLLAMVAAVVMLAGLARRDHADRSVEFWLSLPAGHAQAWTAPLLTHLVLVPVAAIVFGALAGGVLSMVLVGRTSGLAAWWALPWSALLPGVAAVAGRLSVGMALAAIWLSPIVLLMVLLTAWLGRWGLVVLVGGFGVATAALQVLWNQPWPAQVVGYLFKQAQESVMLASGRSDVELETPGQINAALVHLRTWAGDDLLAAFGLLASPSVLPVLMCSALFFAGLVWWRRQGAGTLG